MDYTILNLAQAKEERQRILVEQRRLIDLADKESRGFTGDENTNYENMEKDFEILDAHIRKLEDEETDRLAKAAALEAREAKLKEARSQKIEVPGSDNPNVILSSEFRNSEPYVKAFTEFMSQTTPHAATPAILYDERALQADSDVQGGYIVTPEAFIWDIIKQLENMVFVRKHAKVRAIGRAASVSVPERIPASDSEWTAEIATGTEDDTMAYRKRSLFPHPLAKRIKVSKTLVRLGAINVEAEVRDELNKRFAVTEERAFLNGSGSNQPLGIFTANNSGITTGQDTSAGNTSNAIKADGLINCVYDLPAQYRQNARWIFHRDALKMIRKLKTGDGQYIWQPGITTNRPNTILDFGYDESEYVPNTFTSGLYVGALCDWSRYWIIDSLNMQIQVLLELYAENNQNGYIGRKETDGQPVDERGFRRVTLA